jgi:hypothetical protein
MQHDKGSLRFTKEMPATPLRLGHAIHVTWPVLSAILAVQLALGLLTGFVEGWVFRGCGLFHFHYRPHDWLR